jgi:hypothetical protein
MQQIDFDKVILLLAVFFGAWMILSIHTAIRKISAQIHLLISEVGQINTNIQAIRDKCAPFKIDQWG